ncbi:MAG: M14 family zinc carboxypeptidase, partial [Nocardioidaceae bacterium]
MRRTGISLLGVAVAASLATVGAVGVGGSANAEDDYTTKLVEVAASTPTQRTKVAALGLDTTEHADRNGLEVVLHSVQDADRLRQAGFEWTVEVRDLEAQARAQERANRQYAAMVEDSGLPSGRTSYRHLKDYNIEMRQLAADYPKLTKPLTLAQRSVEGRQVHGIEITTDADQVHDGKPVFLMMGAHHAREWPSSEHAMEFAYDLLQEYGNDARATRIVEGMRLIVVPVVNPDGFHISREAEPLGDFSRFDNEMRRKNCSISESTAPQFLGGTCESNPAGRQRGVDLNRNYPGFWGGPGASTNYLSDTYRGDDPGSEPEVQSIRELISERQVTNLITNHTYGNLTLRAPAIAS